MIKEYRGAMSFWDEQALGNGYAKPGIHSLIIDREYVDKKNLGDKNLDEMTTLEWIDHCEEIRKGTAIKIESLLNFLLKEYSIYQYPNCDSIPYKSNWDMFFWCNGGKDGKDLSYITLSCNEQRSNEEQLQTFHKVLESIKKHGYAGLDVRIQYKVVYDEEGLKHAAKEKYKKIRNKYVEFNGMVGKVKFLENDGCDGYCFFPKWSHKRAYKVSNVELALINI